jgi:hypothetical protein
MTRLRPQVCHSFEIREFVIPNTRRACGLQFLDVLVGLFFSLTAFVLNDLAQNSVHVLGHSARLAAYEKMRAFALDSLPNFISTLQHLALDVGFSAESRDHAQSSGVRNPSLFIYSNSS